MEIKSNTSFLGISSKITPIQNDTIFHQQAVLSTKDVSSFQEIINSRMIDNTEISEKLNSIKSSNSCDNEAEINSDDIDKLNELQKLTNNSYCKFKRIKSPISLSNISSDIEEKSDENYIEKNNTLKSKENRGTLIRNKSDFEEKLKQNKTDKIQNQNEAFKIDSESNSNSKCFEKIPDLNLNESKNIENTKLRRKSIKLKSADSEHSLFENELTSDISTQLKNLKKPCTNDIIAAEKKTFDKQIKDESSVKDHNYEIFKIEPDPFRQFKKDWQNISSNSDNESVAGNEINSSYKGHYYQPYKITPDPFCQFSSEIKNNKQNDIELENLSNKLIHNDLNEQKSKRFVFEERDDDNSLDAVLPVTIELLNH
jgi:hypothetical protein